jgi:NADPH:quinone reductase-like Zn-dependent oxidoreductase
MSKMKAVQFHEFGDVDVLRFEDIVAPEPGPGQMKVHIKAAGVNPVDLKSEAGQMKDKTPLPKIAGFDFSGRVEELGEGVTEYAVGDDVFGRTLSAHAGSYAEFTVVAPSDVARKPRTLDHVHAAALPTAGLAAWQALFESNGSTTIGLSPGMSLLIHGAAGGVGSFAVQLARWKGAKVIATARADDAAYLRALGADAIIDYRKQRFEDHVNLVDAVLDLVGGDTQKRSWRVIRSGGVLVSTVGVEPQPEAISRGVRAIGLFAGQDHWALEELALLVEQGHLRVPVAEVRPLRGARDAQARLKAGGVHGKVVLEIAAR